MTNQDSNGALKLKLDDIAYVMELYDQKLPKFTLSVKGANLYTSLNGDDDASADVCNNQDHVLKYTNPQSLNKILKLSKDTKLLINLENQNNYSLFCEGTYLDSELNLKIMLHSILGYMDYDELKKYMNKFDINKRDLDAINKIQSLPNKEKVI